jgi:hypothetical protein
MYMQLILSACILGAISTTFLVYGLRVLSRLQAYEREAKLRMSSVLCERMMPNESFNLVLGSDVGGLPIVPLYMAVVRASNTPVELSCANGSLCETVKSSVSLLHLFQCACVWVLLWTFRGMQKKNVVPHPIV